MRVSSISRYAICATMSIAILAGCGGSQPPIDAPFAMPQSPTRPVAKSFHVLYQFAGGRDGAGPGASLTDVNGALYGTTSFGGGHPKCGYGGGCGTVFSITTTGEEKVLHRFAGHSDGWLPVARLIDHNGMLYGTTRYGGGSGCVESFGCGTIYTISTRGAEKVFYAFSEYANGTQPFAGLIDVKGTLYGTTWHGGTSNNGTVFSLSNTGDEKVLHSFSGPPDGALPYAGLIDIKGTLYGTTWSGGTGCGSGGCGTVFSISTSGVEKVLYSFAGGSDGSFPNAGLTAVNGMMYGTTSPFLCCSRMTGFGTVYGINISGEEKVLHHFGHGSDGSQPRAGLINVKGTLYGTTTSGGSASGCGTHPSGCGTIFSITTTGGERVLHSFSGGSDGRFPLAGLTYLSGKLYGTTASGGSGCGSKGGCGTVFALTP